MGAAQAAQFKDLGASSVLNMTQSSMRSSMYTSLLWCCWCSVSSKTLRAGVAQAAAGTRHRDQNVALGQCLLPPILLRSQYALCSLCRGTENLLSSKAQLTGQTRRFIWRDLLPTSLRRGGSVPGVHMASASDRQDADSSCVPAAAGGVAAAGGPAPAAAAAMLAHTTPSEPGQRRGSVDMMLYAQGTPLDPLVVLELKRPAVTRGSAEQPAPDAAAFWEAREKGGALTFWMLPTALQEIRPSMLSGAAVLKASLQLQPHVYMQVNCMMSSFQAGLSHN